MGPVVVFELKDRDVAIGRSAGENASCFVWCPCNKVDGCGVECYIVDLLPGTILFAPYEDFAVVRGGCEDVAVLGVGPCHAPDSAFVSVALLARASGAKPELPTPSTSQPIYATRPPPRRSLWSYPKSTWLTACRSSPGQHRAACR